MEERLLYLTDAQIILELVRIVALRGMLMPAYRERVYICPNQNGQPAWIQEFPLWWDRSEFFKQYDSRRIDTGDPIYVNYGFLLTGWEASAWDRRCRDRFAGDPRGGDRFIVESMSRWESMLKTASWVIVESYEWESGLSD